MTLAERLRATLDAGLARDMGLIEGDHRDPVLDDGDEPVVAAAVLVAVTDRPEPGVILTQRPETMRRHPGQVAFPGGRIDPEDDGPVAAALREAEEEIALPPASVEVVGTLDTYRTITGFEVTMVVGVVPPGLAYTPNPAEVAAVFEAPLSHLLDAANYTERQVMFQGRQRRYYELDWEGRRVWGATAAMLVNLGRRLAWQG